MVYFALNSANLLAQVNVGGNPAVLLGVFLAISGAGLYFLRSVRPELSRDHDIFFAAIGLLCGFILLFQGWRLDPILAFGQFLLTGSAIFFAVESIRLRGVATEQAKRSTPIVDEERPVSRVYRAELDELEPIDDQPVRRRIRGTQDARSSRADGYEGEERRRSSIRGTTERLGPGERPRKRRPRPENRPAERNSDWDASLEDNSWEEDKPTRTTRPSSTRPSSRDSETTSRPRRPRPPRDQDEDRRRNRDMDATPVDFKPVDYPDDNEDNPEDFES